MDKFENHELQFILLRFIFEFKKKIYRGFIRSYL